MAADGAESPTQRLRALIAAQLKRMREQRFAERVCGEALAALQSVRATQPQLTGDALYEAVVARRTRLDAAQSRAVVQRAHESMANWGNDREARLLAVVKCMIVSEYLAAHAGEEGVSINLDALLAPRIDPRL